MNNMTVTFMGYPVPINVNSYTKGSYPVLGKAPEDCEDGSAAYVSFDVETNNQLLNDILEEFHFNEIELLVLAGIENVQIINESV